MISEEVARNLLRLREDYAAREGAPFRHFFCPLLFRDEDVDLCMGHVIPECLPNCSRVRVVQRADVDNFYGRVAEANFGTHLEVREKGLKGAMSDPSLQRRVRPRVVLDGEDVKYYPFKGHKDPGHSRIIIEHGEQGEAMHFVLAKSPEEVVAAQGKDWGIVIEHDCRLSAMVTLIKSAYLTLFRTHGYGWALSAAGMSVGYQMLGKFFLANHDKEFSEVQEAVKECFLPYKHMVRPVERFVGDKPMVGTVQDNRAGVCFGSSGRPFGLVVYVRIDKGCHAVLMPAFKHPDSVEAYLNFLKNDHETLRISNAWFDEKKRHWEVSPEPVLAHWPKQGDTFDFV